MTNDVAESAVENKILATTRLLCEHFFPNGGRYSPSWILVPAIRELADSKQEASPVELFERFVAESNGKYRKHLSQYVAGLSASRSVSTTLDIPELHSLSVYTGARRFSFAKLSGMVSFFISRESPMCKQKLNDLLFYADFASYYTYDQSISGAKYLRGPNAPALHCYESILKTLFYSGVIKFSKGGLDGSFLVEGKPNLDSLSLLDMVTLLRVKGRFESMTSAQIREYLMKECVYRFTPQDDCIPYEYAHLMKKLPG